MSVVDSDPTLVAITQQLTEATSRLLRLQAEIRTKTAEFARSDELNKARQLAAIEEGRIPPPDLTAEPDSSANAIRALITQRRRLAKDYEQRLGELRAEVESEAAEVFEAGLDGCRPALAVLAEFMETVSASMRLVARARTAEALADPNEVHRPHAGERTRTRFTIADVAALAEGAIDPLALTPIQPAGGVAVQRVEGPEPQAPGGLKPRGAFGTPPQIYSRRSGRRDDFS